MLTKLNRTLRSAISVALACAMTVTTLTPTTIFAQPDAEEAVQQVAAVEDEAIEADLEALPKVSIEDNIVSYRAYTDTFANVGQKLSYVIIEYADTVNSYTVTTGSYRIEAFKGDNLTKAAATVTAAYTNDKPDIREDKTSVEGKYVIVEIDPFDGVGTMDLSNIYILDEEGKQIMVDGKPLTSNGYGNIESVDPDVYQVRDVALSDRMVKADGKNPISADKAYETLNFNYDAFQDLVLDSEHNNYGDGKIRAKYYLPADMGTSDKLYPLVVVQCGGGLRMREVFDPEDSAKLLYRSYGANIAFDTSVTSWMSPDYKYEDVIVVSVDNRCINDIEDPDNRYVAADDINQVVEYFIHSLPVDPNRVIYSGNSQGSLIGYQTVSSRPDLWTAFMPCNGLALTSPNPFSGNQEDYDKFMEGVAKVMDPITDNRIAVYWNLGETDTGASGERGQLFYDYAKARYEEQGLSQEEIDAILRLNVFSDEEYLEYGITNADGSAYAHGATKLAYTAHKDEFMPWLLGQVKYDVPASFARDVESVQAYTDGTIYGTAVVKVDVNFKPGVDPSRYTTDDYYLEDRGSLNPDFGQIKIKYIEIHGQTATLYVDDNTAATENNRLVYTGNNEDEAEVRGVRERNAFGIYPTGAWYRDPDGVIRFGDGEQGYAKNETGKGYWIRPSLELKIRFANENGYSEAQCMADEKGEFKEDSMWLPTVMLEFGEGKFQNLYDLQIPSTAAAATDGTQDAYVQGYYYVPEDYDPANGIVFYIQGNAISFWKLQDGTNNAGCGFMYDTNTYSWRNKGCIAVNIQDRSGYAKGDYQNFYDYVNDDVRVMKYFIDTYGITGNIVIQGNSRGTNASSTIIKALAGQPYTALGESVTLDKSVFDFMIDAYICQNGTFGGNSYSEEDWAAVAKTGMKVWCFDGEQDANNIDNIAKYTAALKEIGATDEWIEENVRITGLASEMFAYWGESDHSVTRIHSWYFADAAYYGPDFYIDETGNIVYNTKLEDGDTYTLKARGTAKTNNKNGYEYKVYDDLFQVWALSHDDLSDPVTQFVKRFVFSLAGTEWDDTLLHETVDRLKDGSLTLGMLVSTTFAFMLFDLVDLPDDEVFTIFYNAIFDRDPDEADLRCWMNLLENGCTIQKVVELIIGSDEFVALAEELGVNAGSFKSTELIDQYPLLTAFVNRLYRLVLERTPSKAEVESWINALISGKYSAAQVVRGFFKSKEFIGRHLSTEDLIRLMYKAILGRGADESGFAAWCVAFAKYGFEKVLNGFFGAREFAILAESYGIRAR